MKITVIAVAGTAGVWTGINLLGPAIETAPPLNPPGSAAPSGPGTLAGAGSGTGPGTGAPVGPAPLSVPPEVTLNDYGQGTMRLTLADEDAGPADWRIAAPGLVAEPSSGTLKPGRTQVVTLRALRVRHWCGAPAPVTAPLTLYGPKGSATTSVRWSTC
ncbi:hypothetical protein [Thermocatellispora tengchongensis]|uniref:hypothetical protein n=1 Tax=Thermocatellispora tengchongensis TaxID=1073253 RepID=UPI003626FE27